MFRKNEFFKIDIRPGTKIKMYLSISLINLKFKTMLRWSLIFLIIALIAALFGFTGIAAGAASIAKILFFVFLVLFVVALIAGSSLMRKK